LEATFAAVAFGVDSCWEKIEMLDGYEIEGSEMDFEMSGPLMGAVRRRGPPIAGCENWVGGLETSDWCYCIVSGMC
jgi:hypothetical protein